MDRYVKLTVPNYIYRFYSDASQPVAGSCAEDIMADALCAYAGLLNDDVSKRLKESFCQFEKEE